MTSQLVYQRIRNRIIEVLELLIKSENSSPKFQLNELINFWEDWINSPLQENEFPMPVYTEAEDKLLREVSSAINAFCEVTPKSITNEAEAMALPEWSAVIVTARSAHIAMMKRGKFSEDKTFSSFQRSALNANEDAPASR
ncbi:hypothetical protein BAC3_01601 [uncultured bacterium]|nr:hypothetical protein BAC3_01601 [uncultured bacterium]